MNLTIAALALAVWCALAQSPVKPAPNPLGRPAPVRYETIAATNTNRREPTASGTLADGARKILTDSGTPGGTIQVSGCGQPPSYPPLVMGAATVGKALTRWLKNDSVYTALVVDGAVDIVPKVGLLRLLITPVGSFDYDGRRDRAVQTLEDLPAVRRAERRLELVYAGTGGLNSSWVPPTIHIHLADPTLIQALNAIAVADKGGVWYYSESHCGNLVHFQVGFSYNGPVNFDALKPHS